MRVPGDWPSLADEVDLCEELFGARGPERLASWLDEEVARCSDPNFARLFSDHIDLPGVKPADYLHRHIGTASGNLLGGIRFFGRDIARPFVEVIAHSFDDLNRLCDCVSREWSMFAPPAMRLRARPGRLSGPRMTDDKGVYAARCADMRPPTAHVWLEPFDELEDALEIVRTRYRQMAAEDPALARNVAPATEEDLESWHAARQLHAIRTGEAVVGLLAVAPGRVGWIEGYEVNEEVVAGEHRGRGYAASAQAAWAAEIADNPTRLFVGTIDRLNIASRRSAETAGRRRVLETVFVAL